MHKKRFRAIAVAGILGLAGPKAVTVGYIMTIMVLFIKDGFGLQMVIITSI